jgi:hypothetical protein
MEYSYWSSQSYTYKTNPTNYGTYQETEPNYNNSIITIQRLHLRKSTLQEYPNIMNNTFQHLDIQTSLSGVIYTISKSVSSVEHSLKSGSNAHNNILKTHPMAGAHAEASIPGEYPTDYSDPG